MKILFYFLLSFLYVIIQIGLGVYWYFNPSVSLFQIILPSLLLFGGIFCVGFAKGLAYFLVKLDEW